MSQQQYPTLIVIVAIMLALGVILPVIAAIIIGEWRLLIISVFCLLAFKSWP